MFKRVVALLLLPTILLTQWASIGRCHGCQQVACHDRNPHVHLEGPPVTDPTPQVGERHHQGHDGCCHHQGDDQVGNPEGGDEDGDTPVRHHHDTQDHRGGGVVYLPWSLIDGWLTGRSSTSLDDMGQTMFLAPSGNAAIQGQPLLCTHSPPSLLAPADSPASLRTLPLLI